MHVHIHLHLNLHKSQNMKICDVVSAYLETYAHTFNNLWLNTKECHKCCRYLRAFSKLLLSSTIIFQLWLWWNTGICKGSLLLSGVELARKDGPLHSAKKSISCGRFLDRRSGGSWAESSENSHTLTASRDPFQEQRRPALSSSTACKSALSHSVRLDLLHYLSSQVTLAGEFVACWTGKLTGFHTVLEVTFTLSHTDGRGLDTQYL